MTRHRNIFASSLIIIAWFAQPLRAADPSFERGADFIRNELRAAASGIRALALAAHPDDEDGATLSFLRRAGVETHICFCTRGDGGQNEIGPETGIQLAALRTKEIEEAAAILGAKPWYLNLPDFGFSKSVEETMEVWKHDVALERLVRVIRRIRPQIVITNHNPDGTDHGHHRTAGKLLVEAFDAAADPKMFPEQIAKGLEVWAISRIYLRSFTAEGAAFSVDVSKRDGASGLSPSEIGAFALSRHFSQGMLRDLKAGERELRHFSILKSRTPEDAKAASMLEGIKTSDGSGSETASKLADSIDAKMLESGALAQQLAATRESMKLNADSSVHFNRALVEALGLKLEVRSEDEFITPGETAKISVRAANTGPLRVMVQKLSFKTEAKGWTFAEAKPAKELKSGDAETQEIEVSAGNDAPLSYPPEEHIFEHETSGTVLTAVAECVFLIGPLDGPQHSTPITLEAPVPLGLAAPYTFTLSPNPLLIFSDSALANDDKEAAHFKLLAKCNKKVKEPVFLAAAIGEKPKPGETGKVLPLEFKGDTAVWQFNQWFSVEKLNAGVEIQTHVWDASGFYVTPVLTVRRVPMDMPVNMRVALVKGCDAQMQNALKRMQDAGVARGTLIVETPSDDELLTADLNKYQAIVLDIRTTQQRPAIRKMKERLKAFMNEGGTVVCMYQKDFDWNNSGARGVGFFRGVGGGGELAPFPIELSFDRVTREDAPVAILDARHPLLLRPCRIWAKDFEGWAQERGAYFPKKWAPEYTPLLSSHDPGEKPLDGGLLAAEVGRGAFIYTSYFWHHQLRTGVPGAYRMLANMLSYARMKRDEKP